MSGFLNAINGMEIPTFDDGQTREPRIYWHNGEKRAKIPGSFYVKADDLGGAVPDAPWAEEYRFESEQGYSTLRLKVAIIGYRMQAFLQIDEKNRRWLAKYQEGARFQTDILCFVDGIGGPVVWSCKGLTGKAVTHKTGILGQYREGLLKEASKQAGRPMPLWSFWLPIQSAQDSKGQTLYEVTSQGAVITPPALDPTMELTADPIDLYFVGADLLSLGIELRKEYDPWFRQMRGGVEEAAAAGGGEYAPVDETDIPF